MMKGQGRMTTAARLVNELAGRARTMTTRPVTRHVVDEDVQMKLSEPAIDELLRRVLQLAQISDRCGRASADGFPSTTPGNGSPGGGKGGGKTMAVEIVDGEGNPTGDLDHVPTSSTESAALRRPEHDPIAAITVEAVAHLRRAVHELEELDAVMGRADRMRLLSKVEDPPQCYVISELLGLSWDDEWSHWRASTFPKLNDPRFAEPRQVCKWVYWFVRDNGRLPTRAEALKHLSQIPVDRAAGRAK